MLNQTIDYKANNHCHVDSYIYQAKAVADVEVVLDSIEEDEAQYEDLAD